MSARRADLTLALLAFLTAAFVRALYPVAFGFDGLYGQDAYAYYEMGGHILDLLRDGTALPPFFWGLGYPVLLTSGFAIFGQTPFVAQAISLLMGAAIPALVYAMGSMIGLPRLAAFIAASIMIVCGQAVQSSFVSMADIPALFWATLGAALLMLYARSQRSGWLIGLAACLLMAALSRWLYLALIPPFAIVILRLRPRWTHLAITGLACALIALPQVIFSLTNPFPALDHMWVRGWAFENMFSSVFDNPDGHFEYAMVNALHHSQPLYAPYYLTPVFTPLAAFGVWKLRRSPWLALLLGWLTLPLIFLMGIPTQNIRFALIIMPPIALLAGAGAAHLCTWRVTRLIVVGVAAFGLAITLWQGHKIIEPFVTNQIRAIRAAEWAIEAIPAGSRVYSFNLTLALRHRSDLDVRELYYETPDTLREQWILEQADYMVVNVWELENQWLGREPQIAYQWLLDERSAVLLSRYGNWTLYYLPAG